MTGRTTVLALKIPSILVAASLTTAILTACSGSNALSLQPRPNLQSVSAKQSVGRAITQLYSFTGGKTGKLPYAGLEVLNGVLYGTTTDGGFRHQGCIFSITPSGTFTLLHSFQGGSDGAYPYATLQNVNGVLYGTTAGGGATGNGTAFTVTTSGAETVIYSFKGDPDGSEPMARLTELDGVLFGTTASGGSHNFGTVFGITKSGKEMVLHSFKGRDDGATPQGRLASLGGVLYGTTYGVPGKVSRGTVFEITTSGTVRVLHRFAGSPNDGANPSAGPIVVGGTLYGTTTLGGKGCYSGGGGCGTVYSVSTSRKETVLHSFLGGSQDGSYPYASLTDVGGVLYGTTAYGYRGCYSGGGGCGALFKITLSGSETVVAAFGGGNSGGTTPFSHVTYLGGVLYGTAYKGGAANVGTVYEAMP